MAPNNSFKPNLLRYTKAMAEKACHGFGSTTQVGLTQALGLMKASLAAVGALLAFSACAAGSERPSDPLLAPGLTFLKSPRTSLIGLPPMRLSWSSLSALESELGLVKNRPGSVLWKLR